MSTSETTLRRADRFGFAASFLCALHCALLPVLIALLPALGLNVGGWIDLDQGFVIFATLLAGTTLTLGYRRHRAFRAWALLLPALALVWVATFSPLHHHGLTHAVLMTIGGLMLAAAHFVNLRLSHTAATGSR
ncbi:MerC mercury resistance protein [Luteimonas cucumeris]|uniref:MerC mercury resistance protein n=1 Tax=Luteimonas cucumeris TaxID=985012 RepID=A0A562KZY8_9GAMM|nr:MerC domain-containing protein [Luteimonas cucumeris]TWI00961.1 MerC mercury resistance protein [Luteimonas cucumeris]